MSTSRISTHLRSMMSGVLAAAICLAITQIIGLVFFSNSLGQELLYGISLSSVAFGGTYAGSFFTTLIIERRKGRVAARPALS